jgi:hypothetical protein
VLLFCVSEARDHGNRRPRSWKDGCKRKSGICSIKSPLPMNLTKPELWRFHSVKFLRLLYRVSSVHGQWTMEALGSRAQRTCVPLLGVDLGKCLRRVRGTDIAPHSLFEVRFIKVCQKAGSILILCLRRSSANLYVITRYTVQEREFYLSTSRPNLNLQ